MKLTPLYQTLNLLNLGNICKLKILKIVSKYQDNSLPNCFNDFFALLSKLHSYPTRFATGDNYSIARFNKSNSQRSVRYQTPVVWNELPAEIINSARKNGNNFIKRVKQFKPEISPYMHTVLRILVTLYSRFTVILALLLPLLVIITVCVSDSLFIL